MLVCPKCGLFNFTIHTPFGVEPRGCGCKEKGVIPDFNIVEQLMLEAKMRREDSRAMCSGDAKKLKEYFEQATGVKHDQDKPHMNLLLQEIPNALVEVSKALRMGELKYGRENWKKVDNLEDRYLAALLRHLVAIQMGEKQDKESGLSHLAHVAVNALFLLDNEASK